MQAELQRINPVELLYCEDFAEMAIIEPYKGLRRRPIWEFELSTAISELNRQFGTKDLRAFGVEKSPLIWQQQVVYCNMQRNTTFFASTYSKHQCYSK